MPPMFAAFPQSLPLQCSICLNPPTVMLPVSAPHALGNRSAHWFTSPFGELLTPILL